MIESSSIMCFLVFVFSNLFFYEQEDPSLKQGTPWPKGLTISLAI